MKTIIAALTLLNILPLAGSASAQKPVPAPRRGPMTMDVAGVRLGMTKVEALAVTVAASYRCLPVGNRQSFEEQVKDEVVRRQGRYPDLSGPRSGTGQLVCQGPSGEQLTLSLAQVRSGDIVDELRFLVDPKRVDPQALKVQVATRYGRPSVGVPTAGSWCDAGYECRGLTFSKGPIFVVDTASGLDIMAGRGSLAQDADKAAVAAEAARRAPAKSKAAF